MLFSKLLTLFRAYSPSMLYTPEASQSISTSDNQAEMMHSMKQAEPDPAWETFKQLIA